MNWTDFFLYLSLFYVVYYAINVVIDVLRRPRLAEAKEGEGYTFQTDLSEFGENPIVIEVNDPIVSTSEAPNVKSSPTEEGVNSEGDSEEIKFEITDPNPVKSTGGVTNLDSLFALAKEGTIELKKSIVYS
ncbi:hypothetical protein SYJ56_04605 [Algoriphagus sp. D3-2-R+10]|uniref:hypothetical protein n=1 Tax=Algoriphagus aurantiacus TaxID=3103948 RepID=UPI002B3F5D65|nr:hypothetical protein [Algoriphagus sp. D3-2-R+10]MEB2774573.1 hypothetical protein [Algoriphagus sp. D3-2-R+10]